MPRAKPELAAPERPAPPAPFVGQRHVVEYFARIGPGGLNHAYLFHGPRGVGKTTFAKVLTLTLHCERPRSFPTGYCGQCAACQRGIAGSSADTIFVDIPFIHYADEMAGKPQRKTDTLGIETSRLMIRLMELHSYEGGPLVCIVPNFETAAGIRDEPYNALLKQLEEPQARKFLFLTAQNPELLLPTVRSRTTAIRFNPLSEHDIVRQLVTHYGEDEKRALALARRSEGSLGDALRERAEGAAALREQTRRWVLACLGDPRSVPPMPSLGKDDPRATLAEVLRQAKLTARDLLVCALVNADSALDLEAGEHYKKVCKTLGEAAAPATMRALGALNDATRMATSNIPPATIFGWLQVQLRSAGGPPA